SSGIIVSTGAGSTGWHRSILTGSAAIVQAYANEAKVRAVRDRYRFDWDARYLRFSIREPFISKTSGAEIVHGTIAPDTPLEIISHMPHNGVIFSDGVEEDHLDFNSGAIATIGLADRTLRLVVSEVESGPTPAPAQPDRRPEPATAWREDSGPRPAGVSYTPHGPE